MLSSFGFKVGMMYPEKGLVHDYRLEDGGLSKTGKEEEDEEKKSKQQRVCCISTVTMPPQSPHPTFTFPMYQTTP